MHSPNKKLDHELEEGFRKAGNKLKDILIRDLDREIALVEVFVD
ncbi:MAG: hypothetical protein ACRD8W_09220 [Nitrososphaeraceae archaeon]